jgi:hypothetical protein
MNHCITVCQLTKWLPNFDVCAEICREWMVQVSIAEKQGLCKGPSFNITLLFQQMYRCSCYCVKITKENEKMEIFVIPAAINCKLRRKTLKQAEMLKNVAKSPEVRCHMQ